MTTWGEFTSANPELAEFGAARLANHVAYLATLRRDGSPRIHPITPRLTEGHLLVYMYPSSPKAHDLLRDGRFALHSTVEDTDGGGGEFLVRGQATLEDTEALWQAAAQQSAYSLETLKEKFILFELSVEYVLVTHYENTSPVHTRWESTSGDG